MKTVFKSLSLAAMILLLANVTQIFGQDSGVWFAELGEGAWLGVSISDLNKSKAEELKLPDENGVVIERLEKDSPAEKAGLQTNDVIIQFNDLKVLTVQQFIRMMRELLPNRTVTLVIVRSGSKKTFSVALGKRPSQLDRIHPGLRGDVIRPFDMEPLRKNLEQLRERFGSWDGPPKDFSFDFSAFSRGRLGVSLESLTPQLGDYFGAKQGHGALVVSVQEDSPADKAGLKAGDVIVGIDSRVVTSPSDVIRYVRSKDEGSFEIKILRDRQLKTIQAQFEKQEDKPELLPFRQRTRTLRSQPSLPKSVV
jgi:S1-C subfamily serine protease